MKHLLIAAGLFFLPAISACHAPHAGHGHGRPVVIRKGHAHTAHCGHFRVGAKWHVMQGHSHGAGCGHHFKGGLWIRL